MMLTIRSTNSSGKKLDNCIALFHHLTGHAITEKFPEKMIQMLLMVSNGSMLIGLISLRVSCKGAPLE